MSSIKIRVKLKNDVATAKSLISHIMETGFRKDKATGKKIPAHYITNVVAELNGKMVMDAQWGTAISKNPYFAFKFNGAKKGDTLKLSWKDNLGKSDTQEQKI